MKEVTRVKQNGNIIYQYDNFIELYDLIYNLKIKGLTGKYDVEYILIDGKQNYTYCLYFLKNTDVMGFIYPYANNGSNNK